MSQLGLLLLNSPHVMSNQHAKTKNKGLDGVVWTNLKYGFKSSRWC